MSRSRYVLCFVSESQREEYKEEFAELSRLDVELVFDTSMEKVLSLVGELDPRLLIVGMTIGPVEGLEFMAFLMNRYKDFDKPLVVLPDKGDGMPPVLHFRDPSTGRSSVDSVDFDKIVSLAAGPRPAAPLAPAPAQPPSVVEDVKPAPSAAPVAESREQEVAKPAAARPKWLVPLVAGCGVVVLAVIGLIVMSGNGEEKAVPDSALAPETPGKVVPDAVVKEKPDTPSDATPVPSDATPAPSDATPAPSDATPASSDAAPAPATAVADKGEESGSQDGQEPTREFLLPITFNSGEGRPIVSDAARLNAILDSFREQPTYRIELTGHSSIGGRGDRNIRLGMFRATLVMKMLVSRGIPQERFVIKSLGATAPIASNRTEEDRAKNRRVTARLIP